MKTNTIAKQLIIALSIGMACSAQAQLLGRGGPVGGMIGGAGSFGGQLSGMGGMNAAGNRASLLETGRSATSAVDARTAYAAGIHGAGGRTAGLQQGSAVAGRVHAAQLSAEAARTAPAATPCRRCAGATP